MGMGKRRTDPLSVLATMDQKMRDCDWGDTAQRLDTSRQDQRVSELRLSKRS